MQTLAAASEPATRARRGRVALGLARAARPKQWLKNLLLFAAPGAGGVLTSGPVLGRTAAAFAAFCLVSSAMYLANDVADVEADRRHPTKRHRPIAAGRVREPAAIAAAAVLFAGGAAIGWWLGPRFALTLGGYAAVALLYTSWLKRVAILDIAAVASGFIFRAVAGGVAAGIPNSRWFLLLVSFGALFVVAGKRSSDLAVVPLSSDGKPSTAATYTPEFLRYVWMLASALAIAAYGLWAFIHHPHASDMLIELSTVPFVLAMLRYALLLDAGHGGAPEDVLLGDRALQVLVVVWALVYGSGVYLVHG